MGIASRMDLQTQPGELFDRHRSWRTRLGYRHGPVCNKQLHGGEPSHRDEFNPRSLGGLQYGTLQDRRKNPSPDFSAGQDAAAHCTGVALFPDHQKNGNGRLHFRTDCNLYGHQPALLCLDGLEFFSRFTPGTGGSSQNRRMFSISVARQNHRTSGISRIDCNRDSGVRLLLE